MSLETLRAAVYAWVSTTDQNNALQIRELTEYAERRAGFARRKQGEKLA